MVCITLRPTNRSHPTSMKFHAIVLPKEDRVVGHWYTYVPTTVILSWVLRATQLLKAARSRPTEVFAAWPSPSDEPF